MSWTTNTVLLKDPATVSCKEIFQAVCDELGHYYSKIGFKYAASRPKLAIARGKLKLDIRFYSSHSNMPGEYVNLEILAEFYAPELKQTRTKGFLFGHTALFYLKNDNDNPQIRKGISIFGEEREAIVENSQGSELIYSNNCNIAGLTGDRFSKIVAFIDSKIIYWLDQLQTEDGITAFLEQAGFSRAKSLVDTNSNFVAYVEANFPTIEVENALQNF